MCILLEFIYQNIHQCLFKLLTKIHKPCYFRKVNTNWPVKHNTAVCNGFKHYTKLSIPPSTFATVFLKTIFQNTANTDHYTINIDYDSSPWYDRITNSVCPVNSLSVINTEMAISSNCSKATHLLSLCNSHNTLKALEIFQALKQQS